VLTFVPTRYLYSTQKGRLNFWTNVLAVPWAILLIRITAAPAGRELVWASLYFPIYYMGVSWWISIARRGYKTPKLI
jgi:hypothetical protein